MKILERKYDIQRLDDPKTTITIDGQPVLAALGETVWSVLAAVGVRQLGRNDSGQVMGAYCGMGVCYCCLVSIDGRYKRRACQTTVRPGMKVETSGNRLEHGGLK
ncbi:(2Fe-2S)-binding protein [Paraburkholderia rhizosphaerae]|uniref:Hydrogen cyanide synthase HcnA n=1 Tax=Paraburkholderia rhizosphaerae TaxID=480658 RepID=A0A4R8LAC7_9BURK|nr:(2Fe-2S)-binding protein [Paraburkholderia rhizosphaerae]TDY39029.1 hydrogen cyanide synthase HcnA [Paraburkholderia rhizosphaerae]